MMKKLTVRLVYGLLFALPLMMITFALLQIPAQAAPPTQVGQNDCATCHPEFVAAWESSDHGNATTDPAFQSEWEKAGKPVECMGCHTTGYDPTTGTWQADGITCVVCHNPMPANHPAEPMAKDSASAMCGKCHTETYFQWQVSQHRQGGLDCYGCHDPHKTGLKAENAAVLCSTCHRDRSANFTHTSHSEQGLLCADCHLSVMSGTNGQGHGAKDHSFFVSLNTCNSCHVYQMHDPIAVHQDNPTPEPPDAMVAVTEASVSTTPQPVSAMGFTALSGLIGVALGVIIAPWIERVQRQKRSGSGQEK
jgi:hypothetical protein